MEGFKWTNVMIIEITIHVEATHKVTKTNGMVKLTNATWQCSLKSHNIGGTTSRYRNKQNMQDTLTNTKVTS
jgi:hypothetical protein